MSSVTIVSTSPPSIARTKDSAARFSSTSSRADNAMSSVRSAARSPTTFRARCSALVTDAVEVCIARAASRAEKSSASLNISAARCLAGRCRSAVTTASSSVSRCS